MILLGIRRLPSLRCGSRAMQLVGTIDFVSAVTTRPSARFKKHHFHSEVLSHNSFVLIGDGKPFFVSSSENNNYGGNSHSYSTASNPSEDAAIKRLANRREIEEALGVIDKVYSGSTSTKLGLKTFRKLLLVCSYIKSEDTGQKAETILERMNTFYNSNRISGDQTTPTAAEYTMTIHAWSRSGHPKAGENAERILADMERIAVESNPLVKPDAATHGAVINAWAKSGNPEMALEAFERLKNEFMMAGEDTNVRSYNAVIDAWANSGHPNAGEQAERLLAEMENDPHLLPNTITHNAVIKAWAQLGNTEMAEAALARMIDGGETQNHVKPNVRSFNAVLKAWCRSESRVAGEKIDDILNRMKHLSDSDGLDVKPEAYSYDVALECWSRLRDHPQAGERIQAIRHELEKFGTKKK